MCCYIWEVLLEICDIYELCMGAAKKTTHALCFVLVVGRVAEQNNMLHE